MVKSSSEIGDGGSGSGSGSSGSVAPFLRKCYEMVDDESTDSIISWNDTNDSFVISDITQFSVVLLPKYFKHSNFSSFMRQLNIYVSLLLLFLLLYLCNFWFTGWFCFCLNLFYFWFYCVVSNGEFACLDLVVVYEFVCIMCSQINVGQ